MGPILGGGGFWEDHIVFRGGTEGRDQSSPIEY